MSVTVQEMLMAARAGLASVTGETAGYFVLGAADQLGAAAGRLEGLELREDGTVTLLRLGEGTAGDLEAGLRGLLSEMLGLATSRAPALLRAASCSNSPGTLRLIGELEAALIPVNRSAARRALARLHREVSRARAAGKLDALPPAPLPSKPPSPDLAPVAPLPQRPVAVAVPTLGLGARPVVPGVPAVVAPPEAPELLPVAPSSARPATVDAVAPPLAEVAPRGPMAAPARAPVPPWAAYEPEATPFLGSWGIVAPTRTRLDSFVWPESGEHDTERVPPVSFDDTAEFAAEATVQGSSGATVVPPAVDVPAPGFAVEPESLPREPQMGQQVWAALAAPPSENAAEPPAEVRAGPAGELAEPVVEVAVPVAPAGELAEPVVEVAVPVAPVGELAETAVEVAVPAGPVGELAEPVVEVAVPAGPVGELAEPAVHAGPVGELAEPAVEAAVHAAPVGELAEAAVHAAPVGELAEAAVHAAPAGELVEVAVPVAPVGELVEPVVHPAPVGEPAEPAVEERLQALSVGEPAAEPARTTAPAVPVSEPYEPRRSDVAELLAGFAVAESRTMLELSRELKKMAGIGATPCPPDVAAASVPRRTRQAPARAEPDAPSGAGVPSRVTPRRRLAR